jgi:hypothetical protein
MRDVLTSKRRHNNSLFMGMWTCPECISSLKETCTHCERSELNLVFVLFGQYGNISTDASFRYIMLAAKFFIYGRWTNQVKPMLQIFFFKTDHYTFTVNMKHRVCKKQRGLSQHLLPNKTCSAVIILFVTKNVYTFKCSLPRCNCKYII